MLQSVPLFSSLSSNSLNELVNLMKQEFHSPGDVLLEQGMKTKSIYFIVSGEIKMSIMLKSREILLDQLYKNCILGAYGAISGQKQSFTAKVSRMCHVQVLNAKDMRRLGDGNLNMSLALREAESYIEENGVPIVDYSLYKSKTFFKSSAKAVLKMAIRRIHLIQKATKIDFEPADLIKKVREQNEEAERDDLSDSERIKQTHLMMKDLLTEVYDLKKWRREITTDIKTMKGEMDYLNILQSSKLIPSPSKERSGSNNVLQ